jgi:hypothetical protein
LFWYLYQEKAGRGMQHEGRTFRKYNLCGKILRTTSETEAGFKWPTIEATGRLLLNSNEPSVFNRS